jgi:GWxTD domain-containing protein
MNGRLFKKFSTFVCLFVVTNTISTFAQILPAQRERERERWNVGEESPLIFFETLHLIADEPDKRRLDINYRIAYDFFVFVRNNDSEAKEPYVARADIAVEILDSNKISTARQIVQKELPLPALPDQQSEKKFLQGIFSFVLSPGRYTIVTEVNDLESTRKYFDDKRTIVLADVQSRPLFFSDVIFTETARERDTLTKFIPLNYGGDVPFGRNFDVYAEILSHTPLDSLRGSYHITKQNTDLEKPTIIISDSDLVTKILPAKSLIVHSNETDYFYRVANSPLNNKYLVALPLRGDTLEQGAYELNIFVASATESISVKKPFHIRWHSMPMSLRSFERAVMPLQYIMEEKEFRRLKNVPRKDRKKKFDEFWKAKDPTPQTTFNEAMAEFYRRVDYAAVNFATLRDPDGIETDRGRAYILYGPPTKIDRRLTPGTLPQEIWFYTNLNKKLIFLDETGKGDYKFISQEQL